MIKKCIGCGVVLQDTDESAVGYVKDINKMDYCMRCFKLKNYNEASTLTPNYSNLELVELINVQFDKCVFLVDILNISSEVIKVFKKISIPKILVISKLDIIPKSIKVNDIIKRIRLVYQLDADIITISSLKSININLIRKFIGNDKACIAGFTNSGKSSLINTLVNDNRVLISKNVNTTLDFIRVDSDDFVLYDTPGFRYEHTYLDEKKLTNLTITNLIKPAIYQLRPNTGILLDEIVLFNNSNELTNITLYTNNYLPIKKVFKKPDGNYLNMRLKNQDIVIKTVGFISTRNAPDLDVSKLEELIEVRETLFKVM